MEDIYTMIAYEYDTDIFHIGDDGRVEDVAGATSYKEGEDLVRHYRH